MDPIEEALEWVKVTGRMGRLTFSHPVGGLQKWSCWLYDSTTQQEAAAIGTDPKTLSDVIAEALE